MSVDPADAWDGPREPKATYSDRRDKAIQRLALSYAELYGDFIRVTANLDTTTEQLEEAHAMIDQLTDRINDAAATA